MWLKLSACLVWAKAKHRFRRCWTFYFLSIHDLVQIHTKGDWTFEDQLILTCIIADEKDLSADCFLFVWYRSEKKTGKQLSRQTNARDRSLLRLFFKYLLFKIVKSHFSVNNEVLLWEIFFMELYRYEVNKSETFLKFYK